MKLERASAARQGGGQGRLGGDGKWMRANNRSGGPAAPPDEALVVDFNGGLNGNDVIKQADGILVKTARKAM